MKTNLSYILLYCSLVSLAISCANPVSPTGGPKDTVPPMVSQYNPPTEKTLFTESEFSITFDEYVKLDNVFKQVVISPPFEEQPEFIVKGKSLKVTFLEELKPNTTYTINFGQAVKDITEGNVVKNLTYVFSTGEFLDSLSLGGKVVNAQTNKAESGCLVLLYEEFSDSVVVKRKPNYFARTDEGGSFSINNLKRGPFKMVALNDINFNLQYDLPEELIGFMSESIVLTDSMAKVRLKVFKNEPAKLRLLNHSAKRPGHIHLVFNQFLEECSITSMDGNNVSHLNYNESRDTVSAWLSNLYVQSASLLVKVDGSIHDTIKVNFRMSTPDSTKRNTLRMISARNAGLRLLSDSKNLDVLFNRPIAEIKENRIQVWLDSSKNENNLLLEVNQEKSNQVKLNSEFSAGETYKMVFLPKAIFDIYGHYNDSIEIGFKVLKNNELGNIKLTFSEGEDSAKYHVQIQSAKGQIIGRRSFHPGKNRELVFQNMIPGKYKIVVLVDENENGRWDTGNYFSNQQPERKIFYSKDVDLRANWEFEAEMSLD